MSLNAFRDGATVEEMFTILESNRIDPSTGMAFATTTTEPSAASKRTWTESLKLTLSRVFSRKVSPGCNPK